MQLGIEVKYRSLESGKGQLGRYSEKLCGFRSCRGLSRAEGEGQFGPCRGPSERSDAELL